MTATKMPSLLALVTVGVITLLLVAFGALAILDEISQDTRTTTRPLGAVRSIDLRADDGDVEIRSTGGTTASLRVIEEHGLFGGPDVNVRTAGGRVRLDSDCFALVFGNSCSVKWILSVPRGTPIRTSTASGDVRLEGVEGEVGIDTGSGDIEVTRSSPTARSRRMRLATDSGDIEAEGVRTRELVAKTGSGDIELPGLSADAATLDTGSGDIELFAVTPLTSLVAQTGSGDVAVRAVGGPYAVSTDTGSGDEDVDIATDPDAPRTLRLKTGSGDVRVRGH